MVFLTFPNYDRGVKQEAVKWHPCYKMKNTNIVNLTITWSFRNTYYIHNYFAKVSN